MQLRQSQNFEQAYLQIHLSDFAHLWTVNGPYNFLGHDIKVLRGAVRAKQAEAFLQLASTRHLESCGWLQTHQSGVISHC